MRIWRNGRRARHNPFFSQFAYANVDSLNDYSLSPFRHASHGDPVKPHYARVLMVTRMNLALISPKSAKTINLSL